MKYLISTVDFTKENKIRVKAKKDGNYTLGKYTNEHKTKTSKGEIVDEYYKLTLTKIFNDIKEPESEIDIEYEVVE